MTVKGRILIVEDDPGIVRFMVHLLYAEGYEVETADSGEAALRRLTGVPPELILLDLNLPDMTGRALCSAIRARPHLAQVPIIVITAAAEPENEIEDLPVQGYLTKPFGVESLLEQITAIFPR